MVSVWGGKRALSVRSNCRFLFSNEWVCYENKNNIDTGSNQTSHSNVTGNFYIDTKSNHISHDNSSLVNRSKIFSLIGK